MKPAVNGKPSQPSRSAAPEPAAALQGRSSLPVDSRLVLWMALLTFLWGLNAVTVKIVTQAMAPLMGAGLRGVVALGKSAWDATLRRAFRVAPDNLPRPRPAFGHGSRAQLALRSSGASIWLVGSYHPSQQNTQTGRLTRRMFDSVVSRALDLAGPARSRSFRS